MLIARMGAGIDIDLKQLGLWLEAHVAGFSRHLCTGETRAIGAELILPVLRRDGSERECRFLIQIEEAGDGRAVYTARITPV